MRMGSKNNNGWVAGIFTAIAASLCCITPVLAFLDVAGAFTSVFSWVQPFRPYFIGLTIAVFGFAWYQKLRPQKQADCFCEAHKGKSFLAIVTIIAALVLSFPFYAKIFYPKPQLLKVEMLNNANMQQAVFEIKGMSCEGCTSHINSRISILPGIAGFQTSYEKASSTVQFDSSKISADSIAAAINRGRYKVVSQKLVTTQ